MPKVENHLREKIKLGRHEVTVTQYKLGDEHICHVDNTDPGATISRATAASAEKARAEAVEKATRRLGA